MTDESGRKAKTTGKRRGPAPKRELMLARARQAAFDLPADSRPTVGEIAKQHGVTRRQVEQAYAKHKDVVQQEWDDDLHAKLNAGLNADATMTPDEQQREYERTEGLIEYDVFLQKKRRADVQHRSKKKRTPANTK